MAHLLRGKQAGIQRDFSAGLNPQLFAIDEVPAVHRKNGIEPADSAIGGPIWYQFPD